MLQLAEHGMNVMVIVSDCAVLKKWWEVGKQLQHESRQRGHQDFCCNSQHLNEHSTAKLIGEMTRVQE